MKRYIPFVLPATFAGAVELTKVILTTHHIKTTALFIALLLLFTTDGYSGKYRIHEVINNDPPTTLTATDWTTILSTTMFVDDSEYAGNVTGVLRAYIAFDMTQSTPGAIFDWGFKINGIQAGYYNRALPQYSGDPTYNADSIHFWAAVETTGWNVGGNNTVEIIAKARYGGTATFANKFLSAVTFPDYNAAAYTSSGCVDLALLSDLFPSSEVTDIT